MENGLAFVVIGAFDGSTFDLLLRSTDNVFLPNEMPAESSWMDLNRNWILFLVIVVFTFKPP